MTNGECIYRKTDDCMSRMALEKDDFRTFLAIWEFRVTGNWGRGARCIKGENGPLKKLGTNGSHTSIRLRDISHAS